MKKIQSIFGYTWAFLCIPIVLATLFASPFWMNLLVYGAGLTISPWFSGGEVARVMQHEGYQTLVHRPVFDALIGEKKQGFVQVDWTKDPATPDTIDEEIDVTGDGQADIHVLWNLKAGQAEVVPLSPYVIGLQRTYNLEKTWTIRVDLKNWKR